MNIFFDLDGTLLDSMGMWNNLVSDFVEDKGKTINQETIRYLNSLTKDEVSSYFRDVLEIEVSYEDIEFFIDGRLIEGYGRELELRKGVIETLDYLKSKGHNLALATMTDYKYCRHALERLDLNKYLDFVLAPDLLPYSKSQPEFFQTGLDRFNSSEDHYLVDDAPYALSLASSLGIIPIAIEDRNGEEDFEKAKSIARFSIQEIDGLREIF